MHSNFDFKTSNFCLVATYIKITKKFIKKFGSKVINGQDISKKIVKPRILPKNERMNSFLLVCDVFLFVFWENPRPEKNVSRFTDL